jgi:uncharacterized damage-inducible protein DinB
VIATRRIESRIVPAAGFRSPEVAARITELAAVHELLREAVAGLSPEQLGRSPAPLRNTAGMILAHVAMVEVHLAQVGLLGEPDGHVEDVLGLGPDDDGMRLEPGGAPTPAIAGRDLAYFSELLGRAHAHTRRACEHLGDADLATDIVRPPRPDGSQRVFDRRYVLFHMVEHASLHMGQLRTLRRLL